MAVRNPAGLTIDLDSSQYTSRSYNYETGQYVFTVEHNTQFYLSYGADTYTVLSTRDVELFCDGEQLQRVQGGSITLEGSYMRIRTVNRTHEGSYTIRASSGEEVSFQLKIKGAPAYSQLPDPDRGNPW